MTRITDMGIGRNALKNLVEDLPNALCHATVLELPADSKRMFSHPSFFGMALLA